MYLSFDLEVNSVELLNDKAQENFRIAITLEAIAFVYQLIIEDFSIPEVLTL